MPPPSSLYLVAGEVSGDTHGAALLSALRVRRPELAFHGRGGPKMRAIAGDSLEDWTGEAAVLGLWEVLKKYPYFRAQFAKVLAEIERLKPDAVVLIDYPGFNLRLAAELRRRQLPLKIIYYISPQVWAWHRGRIPRMARWLDLMICIFPFEPALYEPAGLRSVFAGHPLVDALAAEPPVARETELGRPVFRQPPPRGEQDFPGHAGRRPADARGPVRNCVSRRRLRRSGSQGSCVSCCVRTAGRRRIAR